MSNNCIAALMRENYINNINKPQQTQLYHNPQKHTLCDVNVCYNQVSNVRHTIA